MDVTDFKRILSSFADRTSDLESDKKEIVVNIRDELIEIRLRQQGPDLLVEENDVRLPALSWIVNRLAKTSMLAERIIDYVETEENFVCPKGTLLDDIEKNPEESESVIANVSESITKTVDDRNALSTQVVYITSDAGEGKTTLINHLAKAQAKKYKEKKAFWLLLPISLGGRPFIRLDDVIIASLVNKFRFPLFYYDSFVELVKLGVIVPALDGFEEMFMESSTGEALSALGQLMNKLESRGSVLIAARKAYFDFKNFTTQARLFDSIESDYVVFSRVSLKRWDKEQFVEYAIKRNLLDPEESYDLLSTALGREHSIITRAVLVKQLLDIFKSKDDFADLTRKITEGASDNYFANFVDAILEREANTKWIDKSGEAALPLITVGQHYDLLSLLSQEMWSSNTENLRADVIDFIVDLYADSISLTPSKHRQVKERIKQHALLVKTEGKSSSFSFDHEEFHYYFLGVSVANQILVNDRATLVQLLHTNVLPRQSFETAVRILKKGGYRISTAEDLLKEVCKNEGMVSFVRENLGAIFIRLIAGEKDTDVVVSGLILPPEGLSSIALTKKVFRNCFFQGTSLENSILENCEFVECRFERLEVAESLKVLNSKLIDCEISSLYDEKTDNNYFDPNQISKALSCYRFEIISNKETQTNLELVSEPDELLQLTERVLRRFLKSTHLNETIFRVKLGKVYNTFETEVLPELLKANVLAEIGYDGSGSQRRFKLGKQMSFLEIALSKAEGSFQKFLKKASEKAV